ncbi:biofilm regulation diguanylate cyclase SiaD [Halomonas sp. M4R5S39]|uniref:biofilm regulation diguanylate cyclase SiaD n=1 Tax=Halomonas kalidii TaxID=3043293 RepID=UPI0024A88E33|nr:biofilm regulation diguanylate cyclase SiaD [Halomonas kalidii]MDI5986127.1 biofilm regulation diguanylate cyclase SiaD [Halomonas kalidii]
MTREDAALLSRVESLLADPAHARHPLHQALAALYHHHLEEKARLERLVSISDGYQRLVVESQQSARQRYDKIRRRQEKLSRISDGYQQLMREHNLALARDSTHDSLTGLPNRRMVNEHLKQEAQRATRHATPYTLAILDIDHFKRINDRHGHEIGDRVLVAIARVMQGELREYDLCARWGGEEFLLLLAETRLEEARTILTRLLRRLAAVSIEVGDTTLSITASAGLSEHRAGEDPLDDTLQRADRALLQAKRSGRNRCCITPTRG